MSGSFIPADAPPPPYPAEIVVKIKGAEVKIPITPRDVDVRNYDWMPLDVIRLLNSTFLARASDREFKYGVLLWCKSWHQVPAGSLPSDERQLCNIAGLGDVRLWRRISAGALHGYILCSDGRYYHPIICEAAVEAFARSRRAQNAANIRHGKAGDETPRTEQPGVQPDPLKKPSAPQGQGEHQANIPHANGAPAQKSVFSDHGANGTSFSHPTEKTQNPISAGIAPAGAVAMLGTDDRDRDRSKKEADGESAPKPQPAEGGKTARGTRIPDAYQPSAELIAWGIDLGFSRDQLAFVTESFRDHWKAMPGSKGVKLDWDATWRNWLKREDPAKLRAPSTSQRTTGAAPSHRPIVDDVVWRARLNGFRDRNIWLAEQYESAPPTDRNCRAPAHLLAEFGYLKATEGFSLLPTTREPHK